MYGSSQSQLYVCNHEQIDQIRTAECGDYPFSKHGSQYCLPREEAFHFVFCTLVKLIFFLLTVLTSSYLRAYWTCVPPQILEEGDGTCDIEDDFEIEERVPTEIENEGVELIASYW